MRAIVSKLLRWFAANARELPWRRTIDPYAIWVSEVMLQQTQVSTVIPYWERWMRELPHIQALARATEQKVLKLWEGLGYYSRARNLHRAAKTLNADPFPRDYEEVLSLPGIGRYTAGAICSIAFNQPTPVLDGNVRRALSRMFARNEGLWEIANDLVHLAASAKSQSGRGLPHSKTCRNSRSVLDCGRPLPLSNGIKVSGPCSALNQALMELGALMCTPRQPRCGECPVASNCAARKLDRVEDFPAKPPRAAVTHRRFAAFVYHHKGRYLVQQRPERVVNARLWEFPNIELALDGTPLPHGRGSVRSRDGRVQSRDREGAVCEPFYSFQHTITRYRIGLEAFLIRRKPSLPGKWLPLANLDRLPFSSAHRKILVALRTQNAV